MNADTQAEYTFHTGSLTNGEIKHLLQAQASLRDDQGRIYTALDAVDLLTWAWDVMAKYTRLQAAIQCSGIDIDLVDAEPITSIAQDGGSNAVGFRLLAQIGATLSRQAGVLRAGHPRATASEAKAGIDRSVRGDPAFAEFTAMVQTVAEARVRDAMGLSADILPDELRARIEPQSIGGA